MVARCYSGAIGGVDASTVEIEVNSVLASSSFAIVGLPDQAVKEAKERVSTALKTSGFSSKKEYAVTVNLAPADTKKEGPIYDLPIAVALMKATGRLENERLHEYALIGELSLSGVVRRVRGILPIVMEMKRIGKRAILVPADNALEASVVRGIDVIPVRTLVDAIEYLNGRCEILPVSTDLADLVTAEYGRGEDFADVKGQFQAKEGLEIAVAGGHNVLMIGSPGSGKTMLARRIPSILPTMTVEEALEVSKIHSVAGREKGARVFVTERPFRAPHHTVSSIGLLGGGTHPMPGEVSLAHRGVLFLDEFAEFPRSVLETLRQPLEDGHVVVSRALASYDYPSRFMLVAAMNPCPCGYYGDNTHACRCNQAQILKYQHRVSGPLMDRIDLQIGVFAVPVKDLESMQTGDSSEEIRKRVEAARLIQAKRYRDLNGVSTNAEAPSRILRDVCRLSNEANTRLMHDVERLGLSARAYDRVLRVARTIADLKAKSEVTTEEVVSACSYRQMDTAKNFWA